ncbi:hypothetical protein ACFE04_004367 [Oxalis oulophora]
MGGVQTKSEKTKVSEKSKPDNGYVAHRRSTGQRYTGSGGGGGGRHRNANPKPRRVSVRKQQEVTVNEEDKGGGGDGITSGTSSGGGDVIKRGSMMIDDDEMVDGWPKWLTDNVPREIFAGLVPKSAEAYDKIEKIGEGTYSNVYKARDKKTGKIVALKKVRFDTSEPNAIKFMAREIMILQKLDHPNIVKLEGLATSRMHYSLYLVFEYMKSDLSRIISRPEGLTEAQVKCYMQQLLAGLQHCHERGILHRDIKGSNLLIDKHGMLKIADFGLANYYSTKQRHPLTNRVVTLWYRAPELLLGSTDYGVGIDLWSVGCLLAEMFVGKPIMPGRTEVEQLHRIFKLCGTPKEEYWKRLKLSTTFRPPQSYKPNLFQVFRDFPESCWGLFGTLLALDPASRGFASSALQDEFFSTRPLACDLSGLPLIPADDDELNQANAQRNRRKMRHRAKTMRERGKKDEAAESQKEESNTSPKQEAEKTEVPNIQIRGPRTKISTTSSITSPTDKVDNPPSRQSAREQAYHDIPKKKPPLPSSRPRFSKFNDNDSMLRMSEVKRSASSREFRNLNSGKRFDQLSDD